MKSEELADILEVIHALIESDGSTIEEIERIREIKKEERGGFSKGYSSSLLSISIREET